MIALLSLISRQVIYLCGINNLAEHPHINEYNIIGIGLDDTHSL